MSAKILAIGNEGFQIATDEVVILVDAFYHTAAWVGSAPAVRATDIKAADLILVTHAHPDHFNETEVAAVADRTGATVVGPATVISRLRGKVDVGKLVELEPSLATGGERAAAKTLVLPAAQVTAYRTFHSRDHNSYLVETKGFRFFHDGDNEDTRRIDISSQKLDALFIGPWQGSGWPEFVEKTNPKRWFLMHLTQEELDQQEEGKFLPDLCSRVPLPNALVTLRPGQKYTIE